jgi:hypothetical protein
MGHYQPFVNMIGLSPEAVRKAINPFLRLTPQEVRQISARLCVGTCGGRKPHSKAVIQALWDDYLRLKSLRKVGALYGVCHGSIGRLFRRHKMPSIRRKDRTSVMVDGLKYTVDNTGYFVGCRRADMGKPLHKLLWEREHGPVPMGHRLIFIDGVRSNFWPSNIRCVGNKEYWHHVRAGKKKKRLTNLKSEAA